MKEYIDGPKTGYDANHDAYRYWECTRCGLQTTDSTITDTGCWRCGDGASGCEVGP